MFLTNILLKKAKSKCVLVFIKSAASDHQYVMCRQRLADKLEMVKWDPFVQAMVLYKEAKKIKSIFAEKLTRRISERFFNERLIWFLTAQLLYHHYLFIENIFKISNFEFKLKRFCSKAFNYATCRWNRKKRTDEIMISRSNSARERMNYQLG
ncbi:mitochondrial ribosomal protein L33 isoform X1 [Calliopsis andreniformis]|uniref:mitochondrial ribosomal protein L33 isoform X1 n=1 Tax=Calliopsis andreniformis TaxID=337506 RepID=UPI003FCD32F6